jgi:hypothetical protein
MLRTRILELEEHLKKYTNSNGHRKYYEKNKDKVMKNASAYLKKLAEENPEKLREYRITAYQNRKNKLAAAKQEPTPALLTSPIQVPPNTT